MVGKAQCATNLHRHVRRFRDYNSHWDMRQHCSLCVAPRLNNELLYELSTLMKPHQMHSAST
jgi:hypothetical protein